MLYIFIIALVCLLRKKSRVMATITIISWVVSMFFPILGVVVPVAALIAVVQFLVSFFK